VVMKLTFTQHTVHLFPKIQKPPENSAPLKVHVKRVSYWRPATTRRHCAEFSHPDATSQHLKLRFLPHKNTPRVLLHTPNGNNLARLTAIRNAVSVSAPGGGGGHWGKVEKCRDLSVACRWIQLSSNNYRTNSCLTNQDTPT
jgi:hypothetical protein